MYIYICIYTDLFRKIPAKINISTIILEMDLFSSAFKIFENEKESDNKIIVYLYVYIYIKIKKLMLDMHTHTHICNYFRIY